jgi:acetyltransferase
LARYIRLKLDPDIAELATSVTDEYQGRGVGSILLDLLIEHAKENGIRILCGYVLKSNKPMIKLLERRNFKHIKDEDGSLRYDLHLNT